MANELLRSTSMLLAAAVVLTTYLGGSGNDQAASIAADAQGNTFIAGTTYSADFPATTPPIHPASETNPKLFVTKLDPTGKVIFSLVLGGSSADIGRALAIDPAGNIYVTGSTQSDDFPTTPNAAQQRLNLSPTLDRSFYGQDAFILKLAPDGRLLYATDLGGTRRESAEAIAVDSSGNAYITGNTGSPDFPTTDGAFQPRLPANRISDQTGFAAKLDPAGAHLVWATYLSGSDTDLPHAIAVGPDRSPVIGGETASFDFPLKNALQPALAGITNFPIWHPDGFVTKLTADGSAAVYSTYIGGPGGDVVRAVAVDSSNHAYVTGTTNSGTLAGTPQHLAGPLLYRTLDSGATFDSLPNGPATSAILALAIDPFDTRTVYAGTADGLFKSVDGGNSWTATALTQIGVGVIVVDPTNSSVLYAASRASQLGTWTVTGNHGGLWKSTDAGATFQRLPLGPAGILPENSSGSASFVSFLLMDPHQPQTLYALLGSGGTGSGSQVPLYRTNDGGATWTQIGAGLQTTPTGFALDPLNPTTLYATTASLFCCGIGGSLHPGQVLRSDDSGATWKAVGSGNFGGLIAAPGRLYSGNLVSTDGGATWNPRPGPPGIVAVDASGIYGIDSGNRLTRSTDGGATFTPIGTSPAQPYTAIVISAGAVYLGSFVWNDAFLTKLDPGGALEYTRYFGTTAADEARALVLDPAGNIFAASLATAAAGASGGPAYVTAFDPDGAVASSISVGVAESFPGQGIASDGAGNLYYVAKVKPNGPADIAVVKIGPPALRSTRCQHKATPTTGNSCRSSTAF